MLAALAVLAAVFLGVRMRYPGKAPVRLPAGNCDAGLWNHVYRPERLQVIEACTVVEGRVISVEPDADGDLHIALDPDERSVLNLVNVVHGGRHLVVEIICEHKATRPMAIGACAGYKSGVTTPQVGQRIRVTGAYVTDRATRWREVHPVTRIEILG